MMLLVYAPCLYAQEKEVDISGIDRPDVNEYRKLLEKILPGIDPESMDKARSAMPVDLEGKVSREKERLLKERFPDIAGRLKAAGNNAAMAVKGASLLKEDERIYIFISSSIPIETLRNYSRDLDGLADKRVSMVMRGFVGGMTKIRPTLDFVKNIILKDNACTGPDCRAYKVNIVIDPYLFRRYGVDAVPAVVYVKGVKAPGSYSSEGIKEAADISDYVTLYGDTALDGALDLINREAKAKSIDCITSKLRNWQVTETLCR